MVTPKILSVFKAKFLIYILLRCFEYPVWMGGGGTNLLVAAEKLGKERQKQMTQIFQRFFDGIGQMFRKVVQYNYCIY
jgi:hypothetical protein